MTQIIYQTTPDNNEYLIDEPTQRLLAYLYFTGPTTFNDIVQHTPFTDRNDVISTCKTTLTDDAAGFVAIHETNQLTFTDSQVKKVSLTSKGREFVDHHQATISVPFSVQTLTTELETIHTELQSLLLKFTDTHITSESTEETNTPQDTDLESLMADIETYFDEIRNIYPDYQ